MVSVASTIPTSPNDHPRNQRTRQLVNKLLLSVVLADDVHLDSLLRVTTHLTFAGVLDTGSYKRGSCPAISYIEDPFRLLLAGQLLGQLKTRNITLSSGLAYIENPESQAAAAFQQEMESLTDPIHQRTLQNMLFVVIYLRRYLQPTSKDASSLTQVADGLASKHLPHPSTKFIDKDLWNDIFRERNLRLMSSESERHQFSANTYLNEVLEIIRIRGLEDSGFSTRPVVGLNSIKSAHPMDVSKLGQVLSSSVFSAVEFGSLSTSITVQNLMVLAAYAPQLPISWFTHDLMVLLIRSFSDWVANPRITQLEWEGIHASSILWSCWFRKLDKIRTEDYSLETVKFLTANAILLEELAANEGHALQIESLENFMIALSASSGKSDLHHDLQVAESFSHILVKWKQSFREDPLSNTMLACISNMLVQASPECLPSISNAALQIWDRTTPPNLQEIVNVFHMWQLITRSRLEATNWTTHVVTRKRRRKSMDGKYPEWLQALISAIRNTASMGGLGDKLAAMIAVGGIMKGFATATMEMQSKSTTLEIPEILVTQELLFQVLTGLLDFNWAEEWRDRVGEATAFISAACLSFTDLSERGPGVHNTKLLLLDELVNILLNSQRLLNMVQPLSDLSIELIAGNYPPPESHKYLNITSRLSSESNPLWPEIGPIASVVAALLSGRPAANVVAVAERLRNFACDLFNSWEGCPWSERPSQSGTESSGTPLFDATWQIFKTVLFTATVIFKSIAQEWLDPAGPMRTKFETESAFVIVRDILISYSHLHFITAHFGSGGFSAYREVIDMVMDGIASAVRSKIWSAETLGQIWQGVRPQHYTAEAEIHRASRMRTLFFLSISEKAAHLLPNYVLTDDVLPLTGPYLRARHVHPELFEAAHSTVLAVMSAGGKRVAAEFGPHYCSLILEEYPTNITVEQLRAAYSVTVKALSEFDDAMAWDCIEQLVQQIENIPVVEEQEKARLERGHLMMTLFDQVGTVDLPLVQCLFDTIRRLVYAKRPEPEVLVALFDVISQSTDYSKKEDSIRFYLDLVEELNIQGAEL